MPIIERPALTERRRITPSWVKLLLLGAVIFGIYFRSCWYQHRESYYEISNIEFGEQTLSSVDVYFYAANFTGMHKRESVLIRLYTDRGEELASLITSIELPPRSRRRYRKMIDKWSRAIMSNESLSHATVEIYTPSIF